ncbi:MAG: S1C family serine protease [Eubacteriales bacterium]|nr:S1C family serine protease [Eubacteriales bacterium]
MKDRKGDNLKEEKMIQEEQEYQFMRETIKKDSKGNKKILTKIAGIAGAGVLFGACASAVFAYSYPIFWKAVNPSEPHSLEIPPDSPSDNTDETMSLDQSEGIDESLNSLSYLGIVSEGVQKISQNARSALVTVTGTTSEENVFNHSYLDKEQAYGIVFAIDNERVYIITENEAVDEARQIRVSFGDENAVTARLTGQDAETGFAVVTVPLKDIPQKARDSLKNVDLGNSYTVEQSEYIIAIGCPYGYADSVALGRVTSISEKISTIDGEYKLLVTDIPGSSQGSGILLNLEGEVVGLIVQEIEEYEQAANVVRALSISQMKPLIERMANGEPLSYVGIYGTQVIQEREQSQDLPGGVFVSQVEENSPAMRAGILSGDIITRIGNTEITDMDTYTETIQKYKKGSRAKFYLKRKSVSDYTEMELYVTVEGK